MPERKYTKMNETATKNLAIHLLPEEIDAFDTDGDGVWNVDEMIAAVHARSYESCKSPTSHHHICQQIIRRGASINDVHPEEGGDKLEQRQINAIWMYWARN